MNKTLIVKGLPLKEFLSLFNKEEDIEILELGDTWHSSSGFVDQTYFKAVKKIDDILNFDYDFKGLIILTAKIRGLLVEYDGTNYQVSGDRKQIEKFKYIISAKANSLYYD